MTLSTPGVFLPWFSVTRFTARALPLNEWVRRRCSVFTFPHFPSCVALTMRVCSRLTLLWAFRQSMACHPTSSWETAPAGCWSAVICLVSFVRSSNVLVMQGLVEVCPISRGVMLQLLSTPLQSSLRFFHLPLPAPLSPSLTRRFPLPGRGSGLPCSASLPERVRSSLFAGSLSVHGRVTWIPLHQLLTF